MKNTEEDSEQILFDQYYVFIHISYIRVVDFYHLINCVRISKYNSTFGTFAGKSFNAIS